MHLEILSAADERQIGVLRILQQVFKNTQHCRRRLKAGEESVEFVCKGCWKIAGL